MNKITDEAEPKGTVHDTLLRTHLLSIHSLLKLYALNHKEKL